MDWQQATSTMRFNKKPKLTHKRAAAAVCLLVLAMVAISPVFLTNIKDTRLKPMGSTEVSWPHAMTGCSTLGKQWSLPSVYQLAAIYYRRPDVELIDKTDYWSENAIAGFAFGLNTGWGIASFDRHADTDHFLCIKRSAL